MVQHLWETYPVNEVVVILKASQIDHQLGLLMSIQAIGLPATTLLNLADEAKRLRVKFDISILSERLSIPVYQMRRQ